MTIHRLTLVALVSASALLCVEEAAAQDRWGVRISSYGSSFYYRDGDSSFRLSTGGYGYRPYYYPARTTTYYPSTYYYPAPTYVYPTPTYVYPATTYVYPSGYYYRPHYGSHHRYHHHHHHRDHDGHRRHR